MRNRISVLLMIMSLMFGGVIFAQDDMMLDPCLGLDQAACDLINEATLNTISAPSFTQDVEISFSVVGIPDTDPISFTMTGSGPVVMTSSGELPLNLALAMNVTASGADMEPVDTPFEIFIVDDTVYFTDPENPSGYVFITTDEATDAAGDQGFDLGDLANTDTSAATDPATMEALASLASVDGFLSYNANGNVYDFSADISTLISSPEFNEALVQLGEATGDTTVSQFGMILPMLLQEGIITVTQDVNTDGDAPYVQNLSFTLNSTLDLGMLFGSTSDAPSEPIVIALSFNVAISGVGDTYDIVAPADARPLESDGLSG